MPGHYGGGKMPAKKKKMTPAEKKKMLAKLKHSKRKRNDTPQPRKSKMASSRGA